MSFAKVPPASCRAEQRDDVAPRGRRRPARGVEPRGARRAADALPGRTPTRTSTPLSRRLSAWACPWEP